MSQHDFNIANQTFPSFRADLNNALVAAATMSAGSSAPTTPYAYQLWFDTTTSTWKVRNSGNTAWISTITTDLATGNLDVTGAVTADSLTVSAASPIINFTDTTNNFDAYISAENGNLELNSDSNNESGSASTMSFKVDNTEVVHITGGNVGIGLNGASPAGVFDARANATARVLISSSGDLIVGSENGGDLLQVVDYGAPNETAANPYIEFNYSSSLGGAESRLGYIGYGSGANTDMYIFNEASSGRTHLYTDASLSMTLNENGAVTTPRQPSFMVTKNADQTLVVGSNETVTWQSETWDVGSNFSGNVFTAPTTGKYYLQAQMRIDNLDTASGYYLLYLTTSNTSKLTIIDPNFTSDLAYYSMSVGSVFDMDAGDVAYVTLNQSAGTASHIDSGNGYTNFCGYLLG